MNNNKTVGITGASGALGKELTKLFRQKGYEVIGFTQKESLEIEGEFKISTKELFKINNEWYNKY